MYQAKTCRHFVSKVRDEDDVVYCKICHKSYYIWETKEFPQPASVPVKYNYNLDINHLVNKEYKYDF